MSLFLIDNSKPTMPAEAATQVKLAQMQNDNVDSLNIAYGQIFISHSQLYYIQYTTHITFIFSPHICSHKSTRPKRSILNCTIKFRGMTPNSYW